MGLIENLPLSAHEFYALFDRVNDAITLVGDLTPDDNDERVKTTIHKRIALMIDEITKAISPLETINILEYSIGLRSKTDNPESAQFTTEDHQGIARSSKQVDNTRRKIGILAMHQPGYKPTTERQGPWTVVWGTGAYTSWNKSATMKPVNDVSYASGNEGSLEIYLAKTFNVDPTIASPTFFLVPVASVSRLQGVAIPNGPPQGEYRLVTDYSQVMIPPAFLLRGSRLPIMRFRK